MPKRYSEGFKRKAVKMVQSGTPQKQVISDLGVPKSTLQSWVREARFASYGMTPPSDGNSRGESAQALRQIRVLETENKVLRRAMAYLLEGRLVPKRCTRS